MSQRTVAATESPKCPAGRRVSRVGPLVGLVVLAAVGIVFVPDTPPALYAQAENGWVGKRVVPRYRDFQLRIEEQVIDPKTIETYRVEQVNGPWLWIRVEGGGLSGWVLTEQVVPVEQAIEFFTDYNRTNPSDARGYTMRAMIWQWEKHELDSALGDYNEAIRRAPAEASVYNSRGVAWRAKQEYDKAIADYSEAIRLDPKYAYAYCNRGYAWRLKQEYDKAIADCGEAIRLDPEYANAYNNRGSVWKAKREYDKAIADYSEAIRLDPGFAIAYNNRGNAWWEKKAYDKAIADYSEAIRLDPRFAIAYRNRGDAWWYQQAYDKAMDDYDEGIRLDPKDATAYHNRGLAWWEKKAYDKAIADYSEAIRLDPEYLLAYTSRGNAWLAKKAYDKAITDYHMVIRLDPKNAEAYDRLAWLWATCPDAKVRDGKKAIESAIRACELSEWREAYTVESLAAAHAEAGDFDAAVKWQSKAIELLADEKTRADYRTRLKLYQEQQPYRETNP